MAEGGASAAIEGPTSAIARATLSAAPTKQKPGAESSTFELYQPAGTQRKRRTPRSDPSL